MNVNIVESVNKSYLPYLFQYRNRTEVYFGGAGSGKSVFIAQKLILKALKTKTKRKILVIRKVQRTQKDSCYTLIIDMLNTWGIPYKTNKSTLDIVLQNGSAFLFKGLDDSEKIKSIAGITDIWTEEATELILEDFTQLNLRLRALEPNLQMFLSFNPISKVNWIYKYFFLEKTNAFLLQTTYKDNKFLPNEYKEEIERLQLTNPAYYRIYALGEFATLDRLVFPIIYKEILNEEELKGYKFFCGLDFGFRNDPTAIVWGWYDKKERTVYLTGEYFKTGLTNDEIAEVIEKLGLRKEVIIADCAEQKSIEEIRRRGVHRIKQCRKHSDSVMYGIQWLYGKKIVIDERLTNLIEEFENYTWEKDKKTGEYINKPIDTFNHGIDAIRYGMQDIMLERKATFKKGGIY